VRYQALFAAGADHDLKGLFRPDGIPLFESGMAITAHRPANPLKQRIRTPHLVIIELVLKQLPSLGTPGQFLHLSLAQSYIVASERLHHELIRFDLPSEKAIKTHAKEMRTIVRRLKKEYEVSMQIFCSLT
jgi:hypothetical protein